MIKGMGYQENLLYEIIMDEFAIKKEDYSNEETFQEIGVDSIGFMLILVQMEEKLKQDIDDSSLMLKPYSELKICDLLSAIEKG